MTNLWWAILAASGAVFAIKLAGYVLPDELVQAPVVRRAAALVTVALLAALVGLQALTAADAGGTRLVLDARVAALGVAVLLLLRKSPFLVVISLAAAVAAGLRALGWG